MADNEQRLMEFEDIYSDSAKKTKRPKRKNAPVKSGNVTYPNKILEFLYKDDKKNTKILLLIIIIVIIGCIASLIGMFIKSKLDMISKEEFTGNGQNAVFEDDDDFSENVFGTVHEVTDASSLDDLLKKWYLDDKNIMSQKYVINVLLIGIDGKNGIQKGGNSDSQILVSINKKTEKITLVSFMRDSRTYFDYEGEDCWRKVNATYGIGGAAKTVEAIENDYKIGIDYYVAVDFTTFPKIIDALGGIEVDIEQYEQEYINRTTTKIKKIPNYGKVKLNGSQALVYSRIRYSDADSDVSRTRRQRTVITSLIDSMKGASLSQLNKAIDALLPYLSTNCPKTKILSYGATALAKGWMDYETEQLTMPDEETRLGTYINGEALWVVDYPLAAQKVQKALYGKTNITLADDRVSALDYVNTGNYSGNAAEYTTYYNQYYLPPESQTTRWSIGGWLNRSESTTSSGWNIWGGGTASETPTEYVPPEEYNTTQPYAETPGDDPNVGQPQGDYDPGYNNGYDDQNGNDNGYENEDNV